MFVTSGYPDFQKQQQSIVTLHPTLRKPSRSDGFIKAVHFDALNPPLWYTCPGWLHIDISHYLSMQSVLKQPLSDMGTLSVDQRCDQLTALYKTHVFLKLSSRMVSSCLVIVCVYWNDEQWLRKICHLLQIPHCKVNDDNDDDNDDARCEIPSKHIEVSAVLIYSIILPIPAANIPPCAAESARARMCLWCQHHMVPSWRSHWPKVPHLCRNAVIF